ncbi:phosphoadenosine phosphosulfate reductase family protein [Methanolobus sp. ZRKC3]|uniref:phosphoadenosine phosphosulfate reductase domain-containing protein n=1 Tax=Methanolobus sp. ZRKC3 TaxID=3125786 RepID=UPI003251CB8B
MKKSGSYKQASGKKKKSYGKKPYNKVDHTVKKHSGPKHSDSQKRSGTKRANYENDYIFWCKECNVPLIGPKCCTCGQEGIRLNLSQPADIRFCSPYERNILHEKLMESFSYDPIGGRIVLLNKIPGDDKTDEVIVDGLLFGILRFDLSIMDYAFDIQLEGAGILLEYAKEKTVVLKRSSKHLNGKRVDPNDIESMGADVKEGEDVLVISGKLSGFGVSFCDANDLLSCTGPALRVRKIDSNPVSLNPKISSMDDVVAANIEYIRKLGKNAINTIKGIANQGEYKDLPVHVSFSGGKDSLVILDLTISALRKRKVEAFFINTGIEFPETLDFVYEYCEKNSIPLTEKKAGNTFWENVEVFGPPAKDFRWCCKVCKLGPANAAIEECLETSRTCLTIDGKRKHESFSRANIAASEMNPFVPGQLNIFPIRDWRAIEVWLYIHWRGMDYNPLYDMGFERVGCYLCPAALSAEYHRMGEIHSDLYERWESFLLNWAEKTGMSEKFMEHGLWRWKELPPKMLKLCENLGISSSGGAQEGDFSIDITSGISPCKAGGYSIEAIIHGFSMKSSTNIMNMMGETVFSEELGLLIVKGKASSVKFFSSGNMLVNAKSREDADRLYSDVSMQLIRNHRCTGCGICVNACPVSAISLDNGNGIIVNDRCIRCGKCTKSCVVLKYAGKMNR